MRRQEKNFPEIPSTRDYTIVSTGRGLLSEHETATDAVKAFALIAAMDEETDASIFKRVGTRWIKF